MFWHPSSDVRGLESAGPQSLLPQGWELVIYTKRERGWLGLWKLHLESVGKGTTARIPSVFDTGSAHGGRGVWYFPKCPQRVVLC